MIERNFKVVHGKRQIAMVRAVKEHCRYNIVQFKTLVDGFIDDMAERDIRKMISTGQCDQGEVAELTRAFDQPKEWDKNDQPIRWATRRILMQVMEA